MRRKSVRCAALAMVSGSMLGFLGCLGNDFFQKVFTEIAAEQVAGSIGGTLDPGNVLGGFAGSGG